MQVQCRMNVLYAKTYFSPQHSPLRQFANFAYQKSIIIMRLSYEIDIDRKIYIHWHQDLIQIYQYHVQDHREIYWIYSNLSLKGAMYSVGFGGITTAN